MGRGAGQLLKNYLYKEKKGEVIERKELNEMCKIYMAKMKDENSFSCDGNFNKPIPSSPKS